MRSRVRCSSFYFFSDRIVLPVSLFAATTTCAKIGPPSTLFFFFQPPHFAFLQRFVLTPSRPSFFFLDVFDFFPALFIPPQLKLAIPFRRRKLPLLRRPCWILVPRFFSVVSSTDLPKFSKNRPPSKPRMDCPLSFAPHVRITPFLPPYVSTSPPP